MRAHKRHGHGVFASQTALHYLHNKIKTGYHPDKSLRSHTHTLIHSTRYNNNDNAHAVVAQQYFLANLNS